jgi:hypothetical protein
VTAKASGTNECFVVPVQKTNNLMCEGIHNIVHSKQLTVETAHSFCLEGKCNNDIKRQLMCCPVRACSYRCQNMICSYQ